MRRKRMDFLMGVVNVLNALLLGAGAAVVALLTSDSFSKTDTADFVFAGLFVLMFVLAVLMVLFLLRINKKL